MYIQLTLECDQTRVPFRPSMRFSFWEAVVVSASNYLDDPISVRDLDLSPERIDQLEHKFKLGFTRRLEKMVNEEITNRDIFARNYFQPRRNIVRLRLVSIKYDSLTAMLDTAGLDTQDLISFALSAMEAFAPTSFQEAIGMPAEVTASAMSRDGTGAALGVAAPSKGIENLNKAWYIANFTLFAPVFLTLIACYFAFINYNHQSEVFQQERTELVKSLIDQNSKISAALIEQSRNGEARTKAIDDVVIRTLDGKQHEQSKTKVQE